VAAILFSVSTWLVARAALHRRFVVLVMGALIVLVGLRLPYLVPRIFPTSKVPSAPFSSTLGRPISQGAYLCFLVFARRGV